MKYIKSYNENIKQYLKPKSPEEILNALGDTTPDVKIILGCKKNLKWLVELGLKEGGNPSTNKNRLIIWASEHGHIDLVKKFLKDRRVDPSDQQNAAITTACKEGHTEIVKMLLDEVSVNPSDYNSFSIIWSCEYGHKDIVKMLLDDGRVDIFQFNELARKRAEQNEHTEIVKMLDDYKENYIKKVYKN